MTKKTMTIEEAVIECARFLDLDDANHRRHLAEIWAWLRLNPQLGDRLTLEDHPVKH